MNVIKLTITLYTPLHVYPSTGACAGAHVNTYFFNPLQVAEITPPELIKIEVELQLHTHNFVWEIKKHCTVPIYTKS